MRRVSIEFGEIDPEYVERLNKLPEEVRQRFFDSEDKAMKPQLTKEEIKKIKAAKQKEFNDQKLIKK